MAASTAGWIPAAHPVYTFCSRHLLPVCLVLLLVGTDLKALARLGRLALLLMLAGSAGTLLGGLASFKLYGRWLPEGSWAAIGALSASWTGGSANLLAVKEALHVPDPLIAPIIVVDALVAYSWMGLLLAAAALQGRWDRLIEGAGNPLSGCPERHDPSLRTGLLPPSRFALGVAMTWLGGLALAIGLSLAAQGVARWLPEMGRVVSWETWTILLVTTAAVGLSLTPARRLEKAGISRVGTFFLYILLATIGARAQFTALIETPIFLALGLTWIAIHGAVLLLAGFLLKAPLGLIATASQAAIGGPISAPIVGATYDAKLAGVGLLMAVLGNLLGTYLGLAAAFLAKAMV